MSDNEQNNEQQQEEEQLNIPDLELTADEEEELKKKIAEMRKRDPFIYR